MPLNNTAIKAYYSTSYEHCLLWGSGQLPKKVKENEYSTVRNIKVGDSVKKLKEGYPEGNMIGVVLLESEAASEQLLTIVMIAIVDALIVLGCTIFFTEKFLSIILIYINLRYNQGGL